MSWKDRASIKGTLQQVSINFISAFEWGESVSETYFKPLCSGRWTALKWLFVRYYVAH